MKWLSFFKKTPLPEKHDKNDPWNISVDQAIQNYGSATNVLEELWKHNLTLKDSAHPLIELILIYLKEQHYKNMDDGK